MNLESQVASLELCKRLKELGVKQNSLFSWFNSKKYGDIIQLSDYSFELDEHIEIGRLCSAFTCSELGELLQWEKLYIFGWPEQLLDFVNGSSTEADARASILVHLIENGLMKI